MHATDLLLAGLAAAAAGLVNALAGGGTLVTFPVLVGLGLPAVVANVTSTVALTPGYLGAALAQSRALGEQRSRLRLLLPSGALGGLTGATLLLASGERLFRALVPALLIVATLLLAAQEPLRRLVAARAGRGSAAGSGSAADRGAAAGRTATPPASPWAALLVGLASIYGGYFGAGVSVVVLAVLALTLDDSLVRLNALKQAIAFGINCAAAVLFLFSDRIVWPAAAVMAVASVLGGALGGRLAETIPPAALRWTVVACGAIAAVAFAVRGEGVH